MAAADSAAKDVKAALDLSRSMGISHIVLLSGDKVAPVKFLAEELGIDYRAGLLPEEKIALVRTAQSEGKRVAMIGDGINDAPALAQADVGIAMGATGSDIAIEAAHIALLREDWMLVPKVFEIARRTMKVVKSNILFTAQIRNSIPKELWRGFDCWSDLYPGNSFNESSATISTLEIIYGL